MIVRIARVKVGNRQASLMTTPVALGSGGFVFSTARKLIQSAHLNRAGNLVKFKSVDRSTADPAPVAPWRLRRNANKLKSPSPVESIVFVMPWLVEDAYAASAAVAGPRMTWESARVFRRRGGQVEGRATVTANGSWMRRSDELIREPSSAAWLNADCPKRSSVLALEGVEELHGTSQARPDGRARLCTRHNRLLLGGPQRSVDHAPKHETSKNFQKTCFSPWLNRRDPL